MPDELIAHLIRVWAAEVENAERLSKKVTGLVSALALLFGLGLFKLDWTISINDRPRLASTAAIWAVKLSLVIALGFFLFGLGRALTSIKLPAGRLRSGATASDLLRFDRETADNPPTDADAAKEVIYTAYVKAINELRIQNGERRARVHRAEKHFLAGLIVAMVGVAIYLLASKPYAV